MLNVKEKFAQNLRKPAPGCFGGIVRKCLVTNKPQEKAAVQLLEIQHHDDVLEVGFGPGHGMKYVLDDDEYRKGTGKLYGVDFSEPMCHVVKKRFKDEIATGKVTILHEDISQTSLPDDKFDKVFHTNCFYFWPDLQAACLEIKRVMKPGGKMVMVMNTKRIKKLATENNVLKYAVSSTPESYMEGLERTGFSDINLQIIDDPSTRYDMTAVSCVKP